MNERIEQRPERTSGVPPLHAPIAEGSVSSSKHTLPTNDPKRLETEPFKSFNCDDLIKRDKINLDTERLTDEALEKSANLPAAGIITLDIMEDPQATLDWLVTLTEDGKLTTGSPAASVESPTFLPPLWHRPATPASFMTLPPSDFGTPTSWQDPTPPRHSMEKRQR